MNRKNGRKINKRQHSRRLLPCDESIVKGCMALEPRFLDLCGSFRRIRGVDLIPPPDLDADMLLWRSLAVRLKSGDFRYREDELKALKRVAQWTVDVNDKLRFQEPKILDL